MYGRGEAALTRADGVGAYRQIGHGIIARGVGGHGADDVSPELIRDSDRDARHRRPRRVSDRAHDGAQVLRLEADGTRNQQSRQEQKNVWFSSKPLGLERRSFLFHDLTLLLVNSLEFHLLTDHR